jgi:hypothetical protein
MMLAKILCVLTLITMISITPAFAESIGVEVNGVMKVNHAVSYTSTGIEIESVSADLESIALIFQVLVSESESDGDINIKFNRSIFDAKIGEQDDEFFIIADGEEIKFKEEKDDVSRTLSFSIPQGTEEFEIFGTILLDESFLLQLEELEKAQALKEDEKRKEFYESIAAMEEAAQRINDRIAEKEAADAAAKAAAEAEEVRIIALMDACGDGTVYVDGECVNQGLVGPQPEPVDSGPLINSIFAAMGIGIAVMIILWGIGKSRHKERSIAEADNS